MFPLVPSLSFCTSRTRTAVSAPPKKGLDTPHQILRKRTHGDPQLRPQVIDLRLSHQSVRYRITSPGICCYVHSFVLRALRELCHRYLVESAIPQSKTRACHRPHVPQTTRAPSRTVFVSADLMTCCCAVPSCPVDAFLLDPVMTKFLEKSGNLTQVRRANA